MRRLAVVILGFFMLQGLCAQQASLSGQALDIEAFVKEPGLNDPDSLQHFLKSLEAAGENTSEFTQQLYEAYLDQNPIDVHNLPELAKHIDRGIALSGNRHVQMLILGDRLLQNVGASIQEALDEETINKKDEELLALIEKLAAELYIISIPVSDWDKLKQNILEGNFSYVTERFHTRCVLDCQSGNCQKECIVAWWLIFLFPVLVVFLLRKRLKRLFTRLKPKHTTTDNKK